jgi:ribosome maturation factor RimP
MPEPGRWARIRARPGTGAILFEPHFPGWRNGRAAPIFCEKARKTMTQVHERERQLHREVAETVQDRLPEVDVLAVELMGPERLCVYIDHPQGVDHALCGSVTEALRGYLDRYSLEVSSPGFERPLRTRDHFAEAVGRTVSVRTNIEVSGRKRFRGKVVEAGEEAATIAVGNETFGVPYDAIVRGNLIEERR